MVSINGEEGLFLAMSVGQDNRAEGVIFKGCTGIIEGIYMRVAHILKFGEAQGLFSDRAVDNVLLR